jgi:hypothetical protein
MVYMNLMCQMVKKGSAFQNAYEFGLCVPVYTYNPNTWEDEAGGW